MGFEPSPPETSWAPLAIELRTIFFIEILQTIVYFQPEFELLPSVHVFSILQFYGQFPILYINITALYKLFV